jgi:2-polyprenyl-3-methyl-5-hydroxy-6-metoxy-1,4-benzoquinol methylase
MRSRPAPLCAVCGAEGRTLYVGLQDRLFSALGEWSLSRCTKEACALIWLNPMPVPEDLSKAYATYYTHAEPPKRTALLRWLLEVSKRGYLANRFGYADSVSLADRLVGFLFEAYPGRVAALDFAVMWLPASRRGRLLDVGAGSGVLVATMNALGWSAEGVDQDRIAVQDAQRRGLVIHLGSLQEQRLPDAAYDVVTMSHSIEHIDDPGSCLAEVHRVLKPGGVLVVATPNVASLGHRWFGRHWLPLDPPRHLHLFNRRNLAALAASVGFTVTQCFTSVREANGVFAGSRDIRSRDRHDMLAPRRWPTKFLGRVFQATETIIRWFWPDAGEDLVLIAEKPRRK